MFPRPLPQQRPAGPALWRSANSPRHQRGDLDGMEFLRLPERFPSLLMLLFFVQLSSGLVINSTLLQKLQKLQKICLNDSLLASFDVVSEMVVVNLLTNIYFNF